MKKSQIKHLQKTFGRQPLVLNFLLTDEGILELMSIETLKHSRQYKQYSQVQEEAEEAFEEAAKATTAPDSLSKMNYFG